METSQRFALAMFASGLVCACVSSARTEQPLLPGTPAQVELDHLMIYAPQESLEADVVRAFEEAGLLVDDDRLDGPDGVRARYVTFKDSYLEILWVEPNSTTAASTTARARWGTTHVSPFGVGLRWRDGAPKELPFPSHPESYEWMQPGTEMRTLIDREAEKLAPLVFIVPDYMATTNWTPPSSDTTSGHNLGGRTLNGIRLTVLPTGYPRIGDRLADSGVRFQRGDEPLIELFFGEGRDIYRDLRPVLPVVLWH